MLSPYMASPCCRKLLEGGAYVTGRPSSCEIRRIGAALGRKHSTLPLLRSMAGRLYCTAAVGGNANTQIPDQVCRPPPCSDVWEFIMKPSEENKGAVSSTRTTMTLPDGRCYSGFFERDAATGNVLYPLPGTILEEDGDMYIGAFNHSWQREGNGRAWLADGTFMEGLFEQDELVCGMVRIDPGLPNGIGEPTVFEGTLKDECFVYGTLRSQGKTYTGAFQDNAPHGPGRMDLPRGAYLEGNFYRGKLNGPGVMRLENGYLYRGEFAGGVLIHGELRTPEYTYEGQFNAAGLPHGTGRSEQLAASQKLIFEGFWEEGKMLSGTCHDEHGTPIDYVNRPDLQSFFSTEEQQQQNEYIFARKEEVMQRRKENNEAYLREVLDHERKHGKTDTPPSRADLGYEYGPVNEVSAMEKFNRRMAKFDRDFRDHKVHSIAQDVRERFQELERDGWIDRYALDKAHVVRDLRVQESVREIARMRLQEQFEHFKKTWDASVGNAGTRCVGVENVNSTGKNNKTEKFGMRNEPWASFYH